MVDKHFKNYGVSCMYLVEHKISNIITQKYIQIFGATELIYNIILKKLIIKKKI